MSITLSSEYFAVIHVLYYLAVPFLDYGSFVVSFKNLNLVATSYTMSRNDEIVREFSRVVEKPVVSFRDEAYTMSRNDEIVREFSRVVEKPVVSFRDEDQIKRKKDITSKLTLLLQRYVSSCESVCGQKLDRRICNYLGLIPSFWPPKVFIMGQSPYSSDILNLFIRDGVYVFLGRGVE